MAKKRERVDVDGQGFGGQLGDLLRARGLATTAPMASAAAEPEVSTPPSAAASIGALGPIRLRVEKKGRGGKTVTLVDGLAGLGDALPDVLTALRKALGAGATQDGDAVVVQGDQRARIGAWLKAQGARDVR